MTGDTRAAPKKTRVPRATQKEATAPVAPATRIHPPRVVQVVEQIIQEGDNATTVYSTLDGKHLASVPTKIVAPE